MKFEEASEKHIAEIAKIRIAHKDRISVFFDKSPKQSLIEDYFLFYLETQSEGFLVGIENEAVVGYVIAKNYREKSWQTIVFRGYLFRWFLSWIRGKYGVNLRSIRKSLARVLSSVINTDGRRSNNACYIASIGVRQDMCGQGIGGELMKYAFEYAKRKGIDEIWLDVGKENIPAIKLFKKAGFEVVQEKNNFLVMFRRMEKERTLY